MGRATVRFTIALAAIVLAGSTVAAAQGTGQQNGETAAPEQRVRQPLPADSRAAAGTLKRWFDVQAASLLARYRRIESSEGVVSSSHVQDSVAFRGRFKFDAAGACSIGVAVATGTTFTGGWNNTGWGTGGDRVMKLYAKQLFVAAAPIKGMEIAVGGVGIARGQSTEITSYDNDGFLMGERVTIRRPDEIYFDEIAFTNAYLGDFAIPNVFDRFRRLDEPNYRQLLVARRVTGWLAMSGEYTRVSGDDTVRAALVARTSRARVIDRVRYEEYRRLGAGGAYGFAAHAEKTIGGRVTVGGGYADIDANYGGLNADRFNRGRRWFGQGTAALTADLSVSFFLTRAARTAGPVANRTRFDVVIAYDALGPIRRAGLFR